MDARRNSRAWSPVSLEFIDTNVIVYAYDGGAGSKQERSLELIGRLFDTLSGCLSTQVLTEFYSVAIKKLKMSSREAEDVIYDLRRWTTHRPDHGDILSACRLHRESNTSWWDAIIVNSAIAMNCSILWTEDLQHGQHFGSVLVQDPFREDQ